MHILRTAGKCWAMDTVPFQLLLFSLLDSVLESCPVHSYFQYLNHNSDHQLNQITHIHNNFVIMQYHLDIDILILMN